MPTPLTLAVLVLVVLGLTLLVAGAAALRRGRLLRMALRWTAALLLLALGALFGMIGVGVQGYRALTHEEVAATVRTEPQGAQRFQAHFRFADGREASFSLAGDELYVDAHILKWKPLGSFLGLHTAYELDRVAGRYTTLPEERSRPRTVHALAPERTFDIFTLRRRYALLSPLVDAEYGSATFVPANEPATLEVRVSTSGLLVRRLEPPAP